MLQQYQTLTCVLFAFCMIVFLCGCGVNCLWFGRKRSTDGTRDRTGPQHCIVFFLDVCEVGSVVDDSLSELGMGLGTRGPLLGCNTAEVEMTKR